MNILLTGHEGWIGSKIAEALDNGIHSLFLFDWCCEFEEWRDFFERAVGVNIDHIDTIIHCGAISDSHADGNLLWDMNYLATAFLAHAAQSYGMKFIYFSSCAAMKPDTQYGWTKRCAEDYVVNKMNSDKYCVLQPFNVWGFDEHKKDNPSVIHKLMNNQLSKVYEGYVRDFIHVDDVVEAVTGLLGNWQSGVFELGTGIGTTLSEFIQEVNNDYYSMPELSECPVRKKRVADTTSKLPFSNPTPIAAFIPKIR